jgi:hypothetical protein
VVGGPVAEGNFLSEHPSRKRTTWGRPSSVPNLGLEHGWHVRHCKSRGFYPTSLAHMTALGSVLRPLTYNRTVCDPACGPTRRVSDLLRVLAPSRIYCFEGNPRELGLRSSFLLEQEWCLANLSPFFAIVTSLPYGGNKKTIMLQNLIRLLDSPGSSTECLAIKMLSNYDSCRLDGRVQHMLRVSIEIKLSPTSYPGFSKPFPWVESWYVFLRNPTGLRTVYYS